MKRLLCIFFVFSAIFSLSAETGKYYNNKKIVNTMYVDSLEAKGS